jgi:mannose-6-phosphate isomerase-like protein (cupin superfamily)
VSVLLLGGRAEITAAIAKELEHRKITVINESAADITSMRGVRDLVMRVKPEGAVLVEGLEDEAAAEKDLDRAFRLNAESAIHLAAACLEADAVPVLLAPRKQTTATAYGETKEKGVEFLQRANKKAVILRVSPIATVKEAAEIGKKLADLFPAKMAPVENKMGHRQDVRRVEKPWGHEIIWAHTERYVGKVLFVKQGERLSLQYHEKKDETVYVLSGKMVFEVGPKDQPREDLIMKAGDSYHITPFTTHRMIALEDTHILEASTPELDDVVRLEDKYGRQGTSKA